MENFNNSVRKGVYMTSAIQNLTVKPNLVGNVR